MPENSEHARRRRADYNHWTTVTIRYCDQDPIGHINNAAMAAFLEQARVALVYPLLKRFGGPDLELVIVRLVIDYLSELHFPGSVDVGTRIARLGTKSFKLQHGVFMAGDETCAALAECTMVFFDVRNRASTLPPAEVRAALEDFMQRQPA